MASLTLILGFPDQPHLLRILISLKNSFKMTSRKNDILTLTVKIFLYINAQPDTILHELTRFWINAEVPKRIKLHWIYPIVKYETRCNFFTSLAKISLALAQRCTPLDFGQRILKNRESTQLAFPCHVVTNVCSNSPQLIRVKALKSEPALQLHSRAGASVDAHNRSVGPDTGRNLGGSG